jgi:hypothetical protein
MEEANVGRVRKHVELELEYVGMLINTCDLHLAMTGCRRPMWKVGREA